MRRCAAALIVGVAAFAAFASAVPLARAAAFAGVGSGGLVRMQGSTAGVPKGAEHFGELAPTTELKVDVVIEARDPQALASFVSAVSDPRSAKYRHYLSADEFASRFGASTETISAVTAWLSGRGLDRSVVDPDHLSVSVEASAGTIESAFGIELVRYRLGRGAFRFAPEQAPLVPAALESRITAVLGLTDNSVPHPLLAPSSRLSEASTSRPADRGPQPCAAASEEAALEDAYTADELSTAYSMPAAYAEDRLGAGVTVALYELEPFEASDISAYQSCFGTHASVSVTTVDGGPGSGPGSGESALDIDQVIGLAPDATVHVYQGPASKTATDAEALDVYRRIADDDTAAVVSTSWGICEAGLAPGFAVAESEVFEQMAAQGQSMLAASGDSGSEDCYEAGVSSDADLAVDDPGSQPDVTSVGGTTLKAVGPAPTETAWNSCMHETENRCAASGSPNGAGGGGISAVWKMPAWQTGPGVRNSFSSGAPCGAGSGLCREVPDVSASSDPTRGDVIYFAGGWEVVGGTSGAAPLWAAVTAIADQGCIAPDGSLARSRTAGLLNPALYALGAGSSSAFNDVTSGEIDFTDTHGGRYPATNRYDMATGWGSPVVSSLIGGLQPAGGCPSVTGVSPGDGPTSGGTTVTIQGSDLSGVTAVDFGQNPATNVSYEAGNRTVTATTPASPACGPVDVTVTTADGTSAGAPSPRFSYLGPSVTSLVPPAGDPAGGTLVRIDGGGFTGATAVEFGSTAASRFVVDSDSEVLAVTPPESGGHATVDVSVTTSVGTSPHFAEDRYVYTLDPVVTSVSPESGTERGGTSVTITGANFTGTSEVYFGSAAARFRVIDPETIEAVSPVRPGGPGSVEIAVVNRTGRSTISRDYSYLSPPPGYWLVASDGGIFSFGDAGFFGSMGARHLNAPIVGMAATADDGGYWLVASDGGIFSFGDAGFFGSMGARHLNAPIVGMAATADDGGYWLVASDGGIFSFGDAGFFGSMGARHLNAPIVGMAATADDGGYWLVASDGGIFSFGDAGFFGSMGARHLNAPIVGMAATADDGGYWLVASDGGIFSFGDAGFFGSMGARHLNAPIVGMAATADDGGYWLVASDGGVFAFGGLFSGSAADIRLAAPVVAIAGL